MAKKSNAANFPVSAEDNFTATFNKLEGNLNRMPGLARAASRAFGAVAAAFGARELLRTADTYTLLNNRLRLVTDSETELLDVRQDLYRVAQDTRGEYESTVELYARVARATEELNLTQKENLTLSTAVNQAIRVSGASQQEAAGGLLQFSQGLAAGVLRGEELNSVLESMPRLAQAIAEGMGVTVGQLRRLGAEGELQAGRVIQAVLSQSDVLQSEFSQMDSSVGESVTTLGNAFGNLIQKINETTNATGFLVQGINNITNAIDVFADAPDPAVKRVEDLRRQIENVEEYINRVGNATGAAGFLNNLIGGDDLERQQQRLSRLNAELEQILERQDQAALLASKNRAARAEPEIAPLSAGVDSKDLIKRLIGEFEVMDAEEKRIAENRAARSQAFVDGITAELEYLEQRRMIEADAADRVEQIRTAMMSETELLQEQLRTRLETLVEARQLEVVSQQEFEQLSIDLAKRTQDEITRVTLEGLNEREKFERLSAKEKTQHVLGELEAMTAGVAQHSKAMFKLNKAAAIANAIVSTHAGVTKALEAYPPPVSFIMAAAVAAAGFARVQAIKSTSFQGGGGGTTPSAAGATPTINSQPLGGSGSGRQTLVQFNFYGNAYGAGGRQEMADLLAEDLRERLEDRDEVIFTRTSRQAAEFARGSA